MFQFSRLIPAVALSVLMAVPAFAQSQQIRFQNNSGQVLMRIYASDTNNDSWEDDLLGANVLQPGQYLDLTIHNVSNCTYDLLMEFENGSQMQDVVNICQVGTYTVN